MIPVRTPDPFAKWAEAELAVEPFVGTFRAIHRGDGSQIDILHTVDSIDADVRSVSSDGVEVFSYDRCHFIPWPAVRSIRISGRQIEVGRAA
jgi:hypothetical protein